MEEKKEISWGARWLLPENYDAAWGARAIADKDCSRRSGHVASLLPDRQSGAGRNEDLKELLAWVNRAVLPIRGDFYGDSSEVYSLDEGEFHARWTENRSFGYVYVVAWKGPDSSHTVH